MSYRRISVDPVAPALGAEISGIDLSKPLENDTLEELQDAFAEHLVIFFRDQDISRDEHKSFARRFGDLHVHPVLQPLKDEGHPEIVVLESGEGYGNSVGMKPKESATLLGFLYEHLGSPEYTCRFHWRENSIAMWDNRCTQHRVLADNLVDHRRMERVTLLGDAPA